jgi:hypothetical protein
MKKTRYEILTIADANGRKGNASRYNTQICGAFLMKVIPEHRRAH